MKRKSVIAIMVLLLGHHQHVTICCVPTMKKFYTTNKFSKSKK